MPKPLFLMSPVTPCTVTQSFGDNRTCIDRKDHKVATMHAGTDTCPNGFEPLYLSSGIRGHNGIDFAAVECQPVFATHPGRVVEVVCEESRGIGVSIVSGRRYQFPDPTGRNGVGRFHLKTRYWHLSSPKVELGDRIKAGQQIGWAGNTGLSSGPHLHLELKPVRRIAKGKYENAFQNNGYRGAIDPAGYFEPSA